MFRFEAPAARRLRRQAARRTRWEIALLALAVGHWAYHKNRDWNLLVTDLVAWRAGQFDLGDVDGDSRWSTGEPAQAIDLTSTDDTRAVTAAR